jgi:xanthine/CO dehydrogenase XdhC/CoxF family maturation factor
MKEFLNGYSLDRACDEVSGLRVHESPFDLFVFSQTAVKYVRICIRSDHGVELLSLRPESEWLDLCRAVLKRHPGLDNDMAFIVVTHAIRSEAFRMLSASQR